MKGIELECLFFDEGQSELEKLGIRPNISEVETRNVTFYNISNISPYYEGKNDLCAIESGNSEYIVKMTYKDLKTLLEQ